VRKLSTKITKSIIPLLMAVLIVTSVGYVNFVKANPIAFPPSYPQVHWGFANNTIFPSNNVIIDFTISINDTIFNSAMVENLQPNYTVTSQIEDIGYYIGNNFTSNYDWGTRVESGNVTVSASRLYSINLTGLSEDKYCIVLCGNCKYNFSEQFNQDIEKFYPEYQPSAFSDDHILWGTEPIYFTVSANVDSTGETALPVSALGAGAFLAVIVAVALLVVYKKRSLKLKVKGEGTEKET
jgi:hypothetical protein